VTTRDWPESIKNKRDFDASDKIRQVVFVRDGKSGTVLLRDVNTGLQDNKYLQITEGLKEGEEVVVAPFGAIARTLSDKTKVKVVEKDKLFEAKTKD
jgi:HlyD family secretion protein